MRTGALVLFLLVAAGASGTALQQGAPAPERITGWFSIVWGDPGPESGQASQMIFTLTDDTLQTVELLIDEAVAGRAGGILALDRRRVTVEGPFVERTLPGQTRAVMRVGVITLAEGQVQVSPRAEVTPDVTGTQPWVSVMCKFNDVTTEPKTLGFFQGMYGSSKPGLDHYWRELSFDMVNVMGSNAHGWYTLPQPRSYYVYDRDGDGDIDLDHGRLATDCTAAADPDIYYPAYLGINLMVNATLDCCAWGGGWSLSLDGVSRVWNMTWEPPWAYADISVIAHEMGHGFGLPHSSGRYGSTYDNPWDVMSSDRANCTTVYRDPVYGCMAQHTIAYHKERLGWITTTQRATVAVGTVATTTLEHVAAPAGGGRPQVARVPIGGTTRFYTVEARKRVGYDSKLYGDAIIIHEVDEARGRPAQVIDADGNGNNGDAGAMWVPGEIFVGEAGITVTVNAATGTGFQVTINNNSVCVPAPITVGQTVAGSIATTDCWSVGRGAGYYADQYQFTAMVGTQVSILMDGDAYGTLDRAYLTLIGPNGAVLASDSGSSLNNDARIPSGSGFYTLPLTGTYTIDATTYDAQDTGAYTLSLTGAGVPPTFSDDPLAPRVTPVKVVHFVELRQAVTALRTRYGLGAVAWTDGTLVPGVTVVKAVHLTELRTALDGVYDAAGRARPVYTAPVIVPGLTGITAAQIAELRAAVLAIW